jgi:hypothetical protein
MRNMNCYYSNDKSSRVLILRIKFLYLSVRHNKITKKYNFYLSRITDLDILGLWNEIDWKRK